MSLEVANEFDIDVDVSGLLGVSVPLLINSGWYHLALGNAERSVSLGRKIDEHFRNKVLHLQWQAAQLRVERRRALRVPFLSRVQVERGAPLLACDISLSGLRCSGRVSAGLLDIEFRLPELAFPVAARAEVVSFKDSPTLPFAGLRFVDIEAPYLEQVQRFIARRRGRLEQSAQHSQPSARDERRIAA